MPDRVRGLPSARATSVNFTDRTLNAPVSAKSASCYMHDIARQAARINRDATLFIGL